MYNHAPQNYLCPICIGIKGTQNSATLICESDIVFHDELVTAFISSFFIGKNNAHVVIVPNNHFENLYDLPSDYAHRIMDVSQSMALAIKKAYDAEGITILQNNEPAGNQHAFHYHLHVFPRYTNDNLHAHMLEKRPTTPEERKQYAENIKRSLAEKI